MVHIGSLKGARDAIDAGANGLPHLFIGPSSDPNFGQFCGCASKAGFRMHGGDVQSWTCSNSTSESLLKEED
jgi:hypothetical protein